MFNKATHVQTIPHDKSYTLTIFNTIDDFNSRKGSGVVNLHIFVQSTGSLVKDHPAYRAPNFINTQKIATMLNVNVLPSYATEDKPEHTTLLLRDKNSIPITNEEAGAADHGPKNIYPYEFNTYINGRYYYIWVLAEDRAGNLELLNRTGPNSKDEPLYTTGMLIDTQPPQFDTTELISGLDLDEDGIYYQGNSPSIVTDIDSFIEWNDERNIVYFTDDLNQHYRYAEEFLFDINTKKIKIKFNKQDDLGLSLTDVYITKEATASADIGSMSIKYPNSDDPNLYGYLVERLYDKVIASGVDDGNGSYEIICSSGVTNENLFEDFGLIFPKEDLEKEEYQHFLYKVSPLSIYTKDGNPMLSDFSNAMRGVSTFIWTVDDLELYFPSSGKRPTKLVLYNNTTHSGDDWLFDYDNINNKFIKGKDGSIQLRWCKIIGSGLDVGYQPIEDVDLNHDLEGFEVQRQKLISYDEDTWTAGGWNTISKAELTMFPELNDFDASMWDTNLDSYRVEDSLGTTLYSAYSYRIRAFDFAGNAGDWAYFNEGNIIVVNDLTPPNISGYEVNISGKIGSWYVEIEDLNIPADTVSFDIRRRVTTAGGILVSGEVEEGSVIGTVSPLYGKAVFTDTYPSDAKSIYAQFSITGFDKNNNETAWTSWTIPTASKTPAMSYDEWPTKNPTDLVATFNETRVDLSWKLPTEEHITDPGTISSVSGLDITSIGNTWETDWFAGKWVRVLYGVGITCSGIITSNDSNSLSVEEWFSEAPHAGDIFEIYGYPLIDLDGSRLFKKQRDTDTETYDWMVIADINSKNAKAFSDLNIREGIWEYAVSCYDLSGNESGIVSGIDAVVEIDDTVPPPPPTVREVIGGLGSVMIQWNPVFDLSGISKYELYIKQNEHSVLASGGEFEADHDLRTDHIYPVTVKPDHVVLHDVGDTIDDIKSWKMKVIAYDGANIPNASPTPNPEWTDLVLDENLFLSDYRPVPAEEPPTISGWVDFNDTRKDGNAEFQFDMNGDPELRKIHEIEVKRLTKYPGGSYAGDPIVITTLSIPNHSYEVDADPVKWIDLGVGNVIAKYFFSSITHDGNIIEVPYELEVQVTDSEGPDLTNDFPNHVSIVNEVGELGIIFFDTIDDSESVYEVWRTPNDKNEGENWDYINFFSDVDEKGRRMVSNKWERVEILPSSSSNDFTTDVMKFTDFDWDALGRILPSSKTKMPDGYILGFVKYAIVPKDKYGNRGKPYFTAGIEPASYNEYAVQLSIKSPFANIYYKQDNTKMPSSNFRLTVGISTKLDLKNAKLKWWYLDDEETDAQFKELVSERSSLSSKNYMTVNVSGYDTVLSGKTYRVDLYETSYSEPILVSDRVTIHKLFETVDGYSINLSNENHTILTDGNELALTGELWNGTNGRAVTRLDVRQGLDQLEYTAGNPTSNQYTIYPIATVSGWNAEIDETGLIYIACEDGDFSGLPTSINLEIEVEFSDGVTIPKIWSLDRKTNSSAVDLSCATQFIKYHYDGTIFSQYENNLEIYAKVKGIENPVYKWYHRYDGTDINTPMPAFTSPNIGLDSSTFGLRYTQGWLSKAIYRVEILESTNLDKYVDFDEITISKIKEIDGATILLSNENHTVLTDANNIPLPGEIYTDISHLGRAITSFKVVREGILHSYTSDVHPGENQFTISGIDANNGWTADKNLDGIVYLTGVGTPQAVVLEIPIVLADNVVMYKHWSLDRKANGSAIDAKCPIQFIRYQPSGAIYPEYYNDIIIDTTVKNVTEPKYKWYRMFDTETVPTILSGETSSYYELHKEVFSSGIDNPPFTTKATYRVEVFDGDEVDYVDFDEITIAKVKDNSLASTTITPKYPIIIYDWAGKSTIPGTIPVYALDEGREQTLNNPLWYYRFDDDEEWHEITPEDTRFVIYEAGAGRDKSYGRWVNATLGIQPELFDTYNKNFINLFIRREIDISDTSYISGECSIQSQKDTTFGFRAQLGMDTVPFYVDSLGYPAASDIGPTTIAKVATSAFNGLDPCTFTDIPDIIRDPLNYKISVDVIYLSDTVDEATFGIDGDGKIYLNEVNLLSLNPNYLIKTNITFWFISGVTIVKELTWRSWPFSATTSFYPSYDTITFDVDNKVSSGELQVQAFVDNAKYLDTWEPYWYYKYDNGSWTPITGNALFDPHDYGRTPNFIEGKWINSFCNIDIPSMFPSGFGTPCKTLGFRFELRNGSEIYCSREQFFNTTRESLEKGTVTTMITDSADFDFMKMNFQSVSWAQFAVLDPLDDESKRNSSDPSTFRAVVANGYLSNGGDTTPNRTFGFVSKLYSNITTLVSSYASSTGLNSLTDYSKSWYTDECLGLTLTDSTGANFTVTGNTTNVLTVAGTPAAGGYTLKAGMPTNAVAFCSFTDSTQNGGHGYSKLEISFDGGSNYQTFLDTQAGINLLEGTVVVSSPGNSYIVRVNLKNDSSGRGAIVSRFLICTDPSCWRF